jgi:predicted nuclease of predicted toxin-antitoxin system
MIFWIDAQLSPHLAFWLSQRFSVTAYAVRDLVVSHSFVDESLVVRYTPVKTGGSYGQEIHRDPD